MFVNRQEFLSLASGSVAAGTLAPLSRVLRADSILRSRVKAIAFDGFVIFDPKPVFAMTAYSREMFAHRPAKPTPTESLEFVEAK